MTKPLRLTEEAEADLDDAVTWYEREAPGLGDRFLVAVQGAVSLLQDQPGMGAFVPGSHDPDARRVFVRRFPYAIVYYNDPTELRVVAIAHLHRRPGYWQQRDDR